MTDANDSALIALLRGTTLLWTDIASRVKAAGSAVAVMNTELGHPDPRDDWGDDDVTPLELFPQQPTPEQTQRLQAAHEEAVTLLDQWRKQGLRFLSLLNSEYPQQLREIFDLPPFLFAQGTLVANDRGVSVIGSRLASHDGIEFAQHVSHMLVERHLTVIAGGAAGIDAAAHETAIKSGGRTVAFLGTGITQRYPAQNARLQNLIARHGALFSQFWPDQQPTKWTFPLRNASMSGYGIASIIVEAGEYSGTRIQARQAQAHGRPLIIRDTVVDHTKWASNLAGRPGVYVVQSVQDVSHVLDILQQQEQDLVSLLPV